MNTLEKKVDTIIEMLLSSNDVEYNRAKANLLKLKDSPAMDTVNSAEDIIEQLLLDVGVPSNLSGHRYLVTTIKYCLQHLDTKPCITKVVYPEIAQKCGSSASKVERAIRHAIETAWNRNDWDVLSKYFGNTVNPMSGKPTNSEFIWRLASITRKMLREG